MNTDKMTPTPQTIDYTVQAYLDRPYRANCRYHRTNLASRVRDEDTGRYSRSCKYHKIEHHIYVHSCYQIRGRSLNLSYDVLAIDALSRHQHIITLPHKWYWDCDDIGLRIVNRDNPDCDYRPDCEQLRRAEYHPDIVQDWICSAIDRGQFVNMVKLVKVTIGDSLLAGNCLRGTVQFARRNNLGDTTDIYAGVRGNILARFHGRAKVAIDMAIARQCHIAGSGI